MRIILLYHTPIHESSGFQMFIFYVYIYISYLYFLFSDECTNINVKIINGCMLTSD